MRTTSRGSVRFCYNPRVPTGLRRRSAGTTPHRTVDVATKIGDRGVSGKRVVVWLVLAAVIVPLALFVVGVFGSWDWGILGSVLLSSLLLGIVAAAVFPIGMLVEALTGGGFKGAGEGYLRFVAVALVGGLWFGLLMMLIPYENNRRVLPILILLALIVGFGSAWMLSFKSVVAVSGVILGCIVLATVFPGRAEAVGRWVNRIDDPGQRVKISCAEVLNGTVAFFIDGEPDYYYDRRLDGELLWLKGNRLDKTTGREWEPVTPGVVAEVEIECLEQRDASEPKPPPTPDQPPEPTPTPLPPDRDPEPEGEHEDEEPPEQEGKGEDDEHERERQRLEQLQDAERRYRAELDRRTGRDGTVPQAIADQLRGVQLEVRFSRASAVRAASAAARISQAGAIVDYRPVPDGTLGVDGARLTFPHARRPAAVAVRSLLRDTLVVDNVAKREATSMILEVP